MIGDYSIMDWVALGTIGTLLGVFVPLYLDNKSLKREIELLSNEHDVLTEKLSSEHKGIKEDTSYMADQMKDERRAREALYQNSSRAKEILETMDMMKEVVFQNAELNAQVFDLKAQNKMLIDQQEMDYQKLLGVIKGFENRLSEFEGMKDLKTVRTHPL